MDWANVTKIDTPPYAKRYPPPLTSMRCTNTISRPGNGELSKVIAVRGPYAGKPTNVALEAAARQIQDRCYIVIR